jgi:hypothetical protein
MSGGPAARVDNESTPLVPLALAESYADSNFNGGYLLRYHPGLTTVKRFLDDSGVN